MNNFMLTVALLQIPVLFHGTVTFSTPENLNNFGKPTLLASTVLNIDEDDVVPPRVIIRPQAEESDDVVPPR